MLPIDEELAIKTANQILSDILKETVERTIEIMRKWKPQRRS